MLNIQTVGKQIFSGHPQKFYCFCGSEYGVKYKYLQKLKEHYGNLVECESVMDLLKQFSIKQFIPIPDSVYVVRYDDTFISSLSKDTFSILQNIDIGGTIICIYESDSDMKKLYKFLPECSVSFDPIDKRFIKKYISEGYPQLPEMLVHNIVEVSDSYNEANIIASNLILLSESVRGELHKQDLMKLFGKSSRYSAEQLQQGVAARNYRYLCDAIEQFDDKNFVIYNIHTALLELDKLFYNPKLNNNFSQYKKCWNHSDILTMILQVYNGLKLLRTVTSDVESVVWNLIAMLQFSPIPSVEQIEV